MFCVMGVPPGVVIAARGATAGVCGTAAGAGAGAGASTSGRSGERRPVAAASSSRRRWERDAPSTVPVPSSWRATAAVASSAATSPAVTCAAKTCFRWTSAVTPSSKRTVYVVFSLPITVAGATAPPSGRRASTLAPASTFSGCCWPGRRSRRRMTPASASPSS